mmetsp:Transcript_21619/g.28940  ORF Transcript_21619/g.28940 Transcript_21619/m.28940 type:complete len:223 (-) Transcript_21619:114-782(-)
MPQRSINSTTIGVAKPRVNLSALSIERMALLIANTVFLLLVLWKLRSRAWRWTKDSWEIFRRPRWIKSATKIMRTSCDVVESRRVSPDPPMKRQRVESSSGPPILIKSMTLLRNQGLAMARPFEAAIRKQELRKILFISSSIMRISNAFLISCFVAFCSVVSAVSVACSSAFLLASAFKSEGFWSLEEKLALKMGSNVLLSKLCLPMRYPLKLMCSCIAGWS